MAYGQNVLNNIVCSIWNKLHWSRINSLEYWKGKYIKEISENIKNQASLMHLNPDVVKEWDSKAIKTKI